MKESYLFCILSGTYYYWRQWYEITHLFSLLYSYYNIPGLESSHFSLPLQMYVIHMFTYFSDSKFHLRTCISELGTCIFSRQLCLSPLLHKRATQNRDEVWAMCHIIWSLDICQRSCILASYSPSAAADVIYIYIYIYCFFSASFFWRENIGSLTK